MNAPSEQRLTGFWGCLVALLIGVITIVLVRIGLWCLTEEPPGIQENWGAWLFWAVFVAAPFGCLALKGVGAKTPWIAAAIVTATYWVVFLAIPSVRPQDGNDLGAFLLLLLYPLLAIAAAFAADHAAKRHH